MNKVADVATLVLVVAGIMVLVRPKSQGPAFVANVSQGFANVILAATGSVPSGWKSTF